MSTHSAPSFAAAQRHLSRRDPVLKRLIAQVGACTLEPQPNILLVLTRSIISQLISTKAALAIAARLETALGPDGLTPETLLALGEDGIRGVGLSRTKAQALLDLATRARDGRLPLAQLPDLPDDEVLELLLPVRGIGLWTGQMVLIFGLGRLDVLPVDDFGLRAGVRDQYGLEELPTRAQLRQQAEPWQPYRSIATWYLWRSRGGVPQSK
jgi:DNA-3-methyladenine glycosylase II